MKHKVAITILLFAVSVQPAAADLIGECRGHSWPDVQLRACAEIIMSPGFGLEAKALAYRNRGDARTNAGAFQQAIADFNEAIRLRPDSASAFVGRARARFSVKNFAGALDDYSEAIRLSPATANLYIERGHVYLSQGNLDASVRDLTEAIRLTQKAQVLSTIAGLPSVRRATSTAQSRNTAPLYLSIQFMHWLTKTAAISKRPEARQVLRLTTCGKPFSSIPPWSAPETR